MLRKDDHPRLGVYFCPDPEGEMIQFDVGIFFNWVDKSHPPGRVFLNQTVPRFPPQVASVYSDLKLTCWKGLRIFFVAPIHHAAFLKIIQAGMEINHIISAFFVF